jgi:uncharacterized Zn finger protein (UPF0148 family)
MPYCHVHGRYDNGDFGCPSCQEAQRQAQDDRAQELFELQQLAWQRANPGDFECPHCKYISLKRDASRCPLCHGTIDPTYWQDVVRRELERKRAEREQEERSRPERERLAREGAIAEHRHRQRRRFSQRCRLGYVVFFGYLLPIATTLTVTTGHGVNPLSGGGCSALTLFAPVVNWLLMMGFLLTPQSRDLLLLPLVTWSVVGLAGVPIANALILHFGSGDQ